MSFETLTLTSDLAELARLADTVEAFCAPLEPAPKDVHALQLALEEVVTNVIMHGYGGAPGHAFTVRLSRDERTITAVITDDAPAFDPLARPEVETDLPLEERPIGGLGVHLVKKLMDSAQYERRDSRNVLTLTRRFPPVS